MYVHGFSVGYPLHAPRAMMKPFFSLKGNPFGSMLPASPKLLLAFRIKGSREGIGILGGGLHHKAIREQDPTGSGGDVYCEVVPRLTHPVAVDTGGHTSERVHVHKLRVSVCSKQRLWQSREHRSSFGDI